MTTNDIPGHEIREVIGEVVASLSRSINPYKEGVKQLRGGTTDPDAAKNLTKWRTDAISKLRDAAEKKGANAVVAMRFDCRQVSATHMEMCAYGTAVKSEPVSSKGEKKSDGSTQSESPETAKSGGGSGGGGGGGGGSGGG